MKSQSSIHQVNARWKQEDALNLLALTTSQNSKAWTGLNALYSAAKTSSASRSNIVTRRDWTAFSTQSVNMNSATTVALMLRIAVRLIAGATMKSLTMVTGKRNKLKLHRKQQRQQPWLQQRQPQPQLRIQHQQKWPAKHTHFQQHECSNAKWTLTQAVATGLANTRSLQPARVCSISSPILCICFSPYFYLIGFHMFLYYITRIVIDHNNKSPSCEVFFSPSCQMSGGGITMTNHNDKSQITHNHKSQWQIAQLWDARRRNCLTWATIWFPTGSSRGTRQPIELR